ncbi:acyl-[acyl-carrier-protein]-phospholipid O-acyltransferase / long-chain-fatty-acid--[acyl-carrier-protein] ligase [Rhodoblastus acidophilus]|uniref:Acyl-[acyl-carrier-protein]-phospholipid O-acyltransferase / long-chain-fatty-acid--[acyl-carrier-protein] ligase n=1 Tax=Rhodoblastus acidophilus TaxID=1074 RepID=A0A212QM59_RHOAC|nr:acyl-[ACP]--phospholipid O-acyltransferase [Rhodoblastus acidophilus]PPQ36180.1 acyl-[ACP]--phospholipid O-acyltransferase [Rhodoblastus acidophilus]RAI23782.1 acyl-[ACP]--phospholipid O-acyltransferase [Rhodoblastus acidophilus]SNB60396.1 acyl-[acyl-carrier-protein]-phospholipid O-acyltransferase / long-chain-fatty-acid--[acyl-carrier-protein] ligase [Rhodoblastus acidophilus]
MFALLTGRKFAPLFWTQFLSAFNDNFLKNALVFLIMFKMAGAGDASGAQSLVTLAGGLFILPFFLLSGLGGQLADRFDKARIAQRLKLTEMLAAALAVAGFSLQSIPLLFAALGLFGCISALFGPIKYGILPDHLHKSELPVGNALIEGATFVAILLGTLAGGFASRGGGDPANFAIAMLGIAAACYIASLFIPKTGEAAPNLKVEKNIFRSTGHLISGLWGDSRLWRVGVMVSLFWMFGAIALSLLPPLVKMQLGGDEMAVSYYLAAFAVAVALGSGLGAFLCAGRIVLLPAPVAALAMGFSSLELALALRGVAPIAPDGDFFGHALAWRVGVDLCGLAFAGGVLAVPSFSAAQAWADPDKRARVVAAVNVLNAAFMVLGAVAVAALQAAGLGFSGLFALMGAACAVSAIWMFKTLPTNPLSDLLSIVFRAFYRLEVVGRENLAKAGPNCIVALNHVSFLDAPLAFSLLDGKAVFAIDSQIAKVWWIKPFLRFARTYALDPTKPLATRGLIQEVRDGASMVIFPEGRLTVTGSLMKVYDGAGMIAEKSGVKVVPVRLDGLESTAFSRLSREQAPRRWLRKVRVTVLEPVELKVDEKLRGKARRMAAGAALYQVMSDLVFRTTDSRKTIFESVVDAAQKFGMGRVAVEDPVSGALTYRKLLIGARVVGEKLDGFAEPGAPLGLMLPNSNAAALAVLGLSSANHPPAMINFTAGPANILAACAAAKVTRIVTSRGFIEKANLQPLVDRVGEKVEFIYLEDVKATVSALDKLRGALRAGTPIHASDPEKCAAILFTSGSEGAPKGVMLSHKNILCNVAQAAARIDFGPQDRAFNILPVFHSFGLTAGMLLPLVSGVQLYLYPSPLHYRIIPELVYACNATILFGTDTLLAGYARSAHPYDFRSLRYVIAGAEPVKEATRKAYDEKFGLRILEGYGVTECAPVLGLNTPMFNKFGTVGRLLPGIEARLEPVPGIAEGGRLHVRGPNIMMGYLRAEDPGVMEPPRDGWHDTGDIVTIDDQGFVAIKGRAKRFAKIGGEMISLAAVEALASAFWPDSKLAVVTQPDPRKGEKLILFTEAANANRSDFIPFAKGMGATELMLPAQVVVVEAIPLLGSGKIDYPAVDRMAAEMAAAA